MNRIDCRFVGTYRYEGGFHMKTGEETYMLYIPHAGDTAQIFLNGKDLGYMANFPGRLDVTQALRDGENTVCIDVTTTPVWERRDGASTHLQIASAGMAAAPVLETWTGRKTEEETER